MKERLRKLRKYRKSGVAMILVLCATALFLALATALLYSSSVLTASANRKYLREQAYQLAMSLTGVLQESLCTDDPVQAGQDAPSAFFTFANTFLGESHPPYDPDDPEGTSVAFSSPGAQDPKDPHGALTISLYEKKEEGEPTGAPPIDVGGSVPLGELLSQVEQRAFQDATLGVRVSAMRDKESFSFDKTYVRSVVYGVVYTLKSGVRVYRDGDSWYYDPDFTRPYQKGGSPAGEMDREDLLARYDADDIRLVQFKPEGGGTA